MSDDLSNDWGCDLVWMGCLPGRRQKVGAMITILAENSRKGNFHNLIEKTTNGLFGLMKLTTNGSDANLYAVTSLMQGNTSGCLIACGSYMSGDSGPLQIGLQAHSRLEVDQLASSVWKIQSFLHSLCNIQLPSLIQLRVQCQMMTYAYMKTSAWNIYTSFASTIRL